MEQSFRSACSAGGWVRGVVMTDEDARMAMDVGQRHGGETDGNNVGWTACGSRSPEEHVKR